MNNNNHRDTTEHTFNMNIISWNSNSVKAHGEEFKNFLFGRQIKPDIICLQETFLKNSNHFEISGYDTVRMDRPTTKVSGGVAIRIRHGINYKRIEETVDRIESITIQVSTATKRINIVNIYCPPNKTHEETDFTKFFNLPNAILLGDFNAHNTIFGSNTKNKRGRILENLIDQHNFATLNTGAGTHINRNGSEKAIDLTIVSNSLTTQCNWKVIRNSLGSDHYPTQTTFNEKPIYEKSDTPKWSYKKADWTTFRKQAKELINTEKIEINPDDEIGNAYSKFTEALFEIAHNNIPKNTTKKGMRRVPYWDSACQQALYNQN